MPDPGFAFHGNMVTHLENKRKQQQAGLGKWNVQSENRVSDKTQYSIAKHLY